MMKNSLIGTIESVSLPGITRTSFVAKIDTGADSSSIWSSNIRQSGNILSYILFAPGSTYYTGQCYQTDKFQITSIRNSFGHEEIRYKVQLRVKIGKIIYKNWFTLANRSRNSYPMLIGKNFLKNRFVVDVSKRYIQSSGLDKSKVFVVTSQPIEMDNFLVNVKTRNSVEVEYKTAMFENLLFNINGNLTTIINTVDNDMDIANYSLVYVKSHWNYPELASALAEYLVYKSKPFFDRELSNYTSRGKLSESMKLATHGIPVPRLFAGYPKLIKSQSNKIISDLGFPFVLKSASADKGKDNYFVNDKATFNQLIDKISENDIYIAQAFIPNDGFYRINVFKNEAKLAIYRSRYHSNNPLKDHLNKPFGGINAKIIPIESLGSELVQLAVKSSIYMDREIAGVDIIQNKDDGKYYILEVNSSPQLRSGSYIDEKAAEFAKFIDKELKK